MNFIIDTHTHTLASGHAYNTIDEMTRQAADAGFHYLAITDHAPKMPGSAHKLYFSNLKVVPRDKFGVHRLMGCEVNIMDSNGKLDLSEYVLKQMDIVIASLHIPCIKPDSKRKNTQTILQAMKNPYVNIIGHPDDSRYPIDIEAVVKAAKENHKLLELNNTSLNPAGPREGALENDIRMLTLCKEMGVCITVGSDAHIAEDIGNFERAKNVLETVDFPERLVANTDIELLKSYLHSDRI